MSRDPLVGPAHWHARLGRIVGTLVVGAAPALGTVAISAATYTRRVIGANAGASNAVGSYYLGAISELFVANVAFSAGQEDQAHGYLCWKYGRESSLPGGHAYRNSPPMV